MSFKFLKSSLIESASYSAGKLWLQFKNGSSYIYYDVPYELYETLVNSPSPGRTYNQKIKGKFRQKKST